MKRKNLAQLASGAQSAPPVWLAESMDSVLVLGHEVEMGLACAA